MRHASARTAMQDRPGGPHTVHRRLTMTDTAPEAAPDTAGNTSAIAGAGDTRRHSWLWGSPAARLEYLTLDCRDSMVPVVGTPTHPHDLDIATLARTLSTTPATEDTTYVINADALDRRGHEHLHTALAWAGAQHATLIVHSHQPPNDPQCTAHTTSTHVTGTHTTNVHGENSHTTNVHAENTGPRT